jgi:hypothetical protein
VNLFVDIDDARLLADQRQARIGHIGRYQVAEKDYIVVQEAVRCQREVGPAECSFEWNTLRIVCQKTLYKNFKKKY